MGLFRTLTYDLRTAIVPIGEDALQRVRELAPSLCTMAPISLAVSPYKACQGQETSRLRGVSCSFGTACPSAPDFVQVVLIVRLVQRDLLPLPCSGIFGGRLAQFRHFGNSSCRSVLFILLLTVKLVDFLAVFVVTGGGAKPFRDGTHPRSHDRRVTEQ